MHSSDERLLAWIDGELEAAEADRVRGHLESCPDCRSRLSAIEAMVADNRQALTRLDAEPPPIRAEEILKRARRTSPAGQSGRAGGRRSPAAAGSGRFLRAAGLAALLATAAVAVAIPGSPIRDAATGMIERLRPGSDPAPPANAETAAGVEVVPGERLVIAFVAAQDTGAIEVDLEPGRGARVTASETTVSFAVGADSISVANAGARASYRITLPDGLPDAEIRVAGTTVFRSSVGIAETLGSPVEGRATIPFARIGPGTDE